MTSVDLLIFVEHVARELDIACLIKQRLESEQGASKQRASIQIASLSHDLDATLRRWKPRVIALPYFYSSDDEGVHDIVRQYPQATLVNLAYEQILFRGNYAQKRPRDIAAREHVLHLTAGQFFSDFLVRSGVPSENTRVVGSLSCGLIRPPYANYFRTSREQLAQQYDLDTEKQWLFFPENYWAAFFTEKERKQRVKRGFDEHHLQTYIDFSKSGFQQVMQWCAAVARSGACEVILRPRPAMTSNLYRDALRNLLGENLPSHLHVIKEGTIREWILVSDAVTSSISTSLVESAVAKKPTFMAMPDEVPDFLHSDFFDHTPQLKTEEAFVAMATKQALSHQENQLATWAEKELFAQGDPLAEVIKVFGDILEDCIPSPSPPRFSTVDRWQFIARKTKGHTKRMLRRAFPKPDQESTLMNLHCDRFNENDIQQRVARWGTIPSTQQKAA